MQVPNQADGDDPTQRTLTITAPSQALADDAKREIEGLVFADSAADHGKEIEGVVDVLRVVVPAEKVRRPPSPPLLVVCSVPFPARRRRARRLLLRWRWWSVCVSSIRSAAGPTIHPPTRRAGR